jgi:hypothetical protein
MIFLLVYGLIKYSNSQKSYEDDNNYTDGDGNTYIDNTVIVENNRPSYYRQPKEKPMFTAPKGLSNMKTDYFSKNHSIKVSPTIKKRRRK